MTDREILPYFASYVKVKLHGKYDMLSQEAFDEIKKYTPDITKEIYMEIINNYNRLSNRFFNVVEKIEDEFFFGVISFDE